MHVLTTLVRLVLLALAVVMAWAIVAAGFGGGHGSVALGLFLAGFVILAAWMAWDILKSWGLVPAAHIRIDGDRIAVATPVWRRAFARGSLRAGDPITVTHREVPVVPAGKTVHVYELQQKHASVRYQAPAPLSAGSAAELERMFEEAGSTVVFAESAAQGRRRRPRRSSRSLDP